MIVAVLDGGVDYNHKDLDPGNRSRIIQGYDVADNDGNPMDDISSGKGFANHGTAVAGIIGAITNNNTKVAGVMWNVKVMPIKVAWTSGPWWDPFGWTMGNTSNGNVAEGVDYALQNGADIINMSLGGDGVSGKWYSTFINNPVTEATYNAYQQDILVIASMGNDGQEKEKYPAAFPWVMAIGASTQNDSKASFSNSGDHIDVVAPGVNYYTTYRNNSDGSFGGTSASAPVTSGVAGLILSESKDLGLNLTNDDIRHLIQVTADDKGPTGFDIDYGHGRVNANEALKLINPPNIVEHGTKTGGSSTLTWGSHTHTFYRGMGTLAAGTYYGVKQYKVTGFASFSNYFTSTPKVWIRERTTKGWSGANPNLEVPWVNITSVTNSGFYYETFVYWIGTNSAGQSINAYYPASPSQAKITYTAVGIPGTSPPATPTNLVITNAGSMGSPILDWDDNSEPDLDHYKVFRTKKRLSDGFIYSPVHIASPTGSSYTDSWIIMGSGNPYDYRYHVQAVNPAGSSPNSNFTQWVNANSPMKVVGNDTQNRPDKFELSSNYPNPFNPTTTIKYGLPEKADVVLSVYNLLGRKVATLVNQSQTSGFYAINFDGQGLASGLYIARLQAVGQSGQEFIKELKMQMIK